MKKDQVNDNKTVDDTQIEIDDISNLVNRGFIDTLRSLRVYKLATSNILFGYYASDH